MASQTVPAKPTRPGTPPNLPKTRLPKPGKGKPARRFNPETKEWTK